MANLVGFLLLFSVLRCTNGARWSSARMPFPSHSPDMVSLMKTITKGEKQLNGCSDFQSVPKDSLVFKPELSYGSVAPWQTPTATMVRSSTVTNVMNTMRAALVPGLGNTTFGGVFDTFLAGGCWVFIKGGMVRDAFLGLPPADVDIAFSCSTDQAKSIILAQGWHFVGTDIFNIGKLDPHQHTDFETIDALNWNLLAGPFAAFADLEYTTNTLFYDISLNLATLDVTGLGVPDTCNKVVRITAPQYQWSSWMTSGKVVRYWKLVAEPKKYKPADSATRQFLLTQFVYHWAVPDSTTNQTIEYWIIKFACTKGLHGVLENGKCLIECPVNEHDLLKRDQLFKAMSKDLGSFYKKRVKPYTKYWCKGADQKKHHDKDGEGEGKHSHKGGGNGEGKHGKGKHGKHGKHGKGKHQDKQH